MNNISFSPARFLALCLAALVSLAAFAGVAQAETRTLDIYFSHTKKRQKITFKRNGKYVKSGLRKLDKLLRDHRRKESTRMDPKLYDLVWQIYKESGSRKPIHVISGYRSPKTNAMLRRRGRKTARKSQHMRGKAIDWRVSDVSVSKLRAIALKQHGGGVGYYRNSFIHTDTARVRHWPRMSRKQLARVFPKGRTIHVPSNGKPLKGYKTALANLKKGLRYDGRRPRYRSDRPASLLARIFRRDGSDDATEDDDVAVAKRSLPKPRSRPSSPAVPAAVIAQADDGADDGAAAATEIAQATPEALPEDTGTDLFAADAAARAENVKPVRIARAIVPALRPGAALPAANQTQTVLAAAVPAAASTTTALRPGGELVGPRRPLEGFSVAQLRARRASAAAYARAEEAPAARATEAFATASLQPSGAPVRKPVQTAAQTVALPPVLPEEPTSIPFQIAKAEPAPVLRAAPDAPTTAPATRDAKALGDRVLAALPTPALRRPAQRPAQRPVERAVAPAAPMLDGETIVAAAPASELLRTAPALPALSKRGSKAALPSPIRGDAPLVMVRVAAAPAAAPELSIGDLHGATVKNWALARTTRRGAFAGMRAPKYRRAVDLATSPAVSAQGFVPRRGQQATRFAGRAMVRVRYQELAALR